MGKWAERLALKTLQSPNGGTDKTAERGVLSVLAVPQKGGDCDFQVAPLPGDAVAIAAPDLSTVAWTDDDIGRFITRRARLMRWGWSEPDAERLAERLVLRDRVGDDRASCAECQHHRPGRCGNHRAAGLHSPEVGRDLVAMLQRCPGFGGSVPAG